MPAVNTDNLKKKARAPEAKPPRGPVSPKNEIQFGQAIETDKIRVDFDLEKLQITYTLKSTGEVFTKQYPDGRGAQKAHALKIIHGRISNNPEGRYTQECVNKARIAMMRQMPL